LKIVKIPFDQRIVDDFDELKDEADDEKVTFQIIGAENEMRNNSVIAYVKAAGKKLKDDAFSGGKVLYVLLRVIKTTLPDFQNGFEFWFKIGVDTLIQIVGEEDTGDLEMTRESIVGRRLLIERPGKIKKMEDSGVSFVYNSQKISIIEDE